jgi:hypothetical protein
LPRPDQRKRRAGRNRGRELHLFHGDGRIDVGKFQPLDHALVHRVVGLDVGHDDAQQIVGVAGQPPGLDDLRDVADHPPERLQPVRLVARRLHRGEHGHRHVDLASVQQGNPPGDDAVLVEPLDPAPAGRRAEADLFGNGGDRNRGIVLQDIENPAINGIHALIPPGL